MQLTMKQLSVLMHAINHETSIFMFAIKHGIVLSTVNPETVKRIDVWNKPWKSVLV